MGNQYPIEGDSLSQAKIRENNAHSLLLKYYGEGQTPEIRMEARKKVANNMLGPNAYHDSCLERGKAILAGRNLILENAHSLVSQTDEQILIENINNKETERLITEKWESIASDKASLNGLVKLLAEEVNEKVYGNSKDLEKIVKKDLTNAENHSNWRFRETLSSIIEFDGETCQVRIDEPITRLTKEQENQWLKILDKKNPPKWFKKLPNWEQNFLRQRLIQWGEENKDKKSPQNIGDYLGVPPTTIRGYPGARNGYKSFFYNYKRDENGKLTLINQAFKIRSGHISPSKIKDNNERQAIVKQNIKQLILAHAQEQINQGKTNLLVDLQTLVTPPFDYTMDQDRLDAVQALRKELAGENFQAFLKENGIEIEKGKNINLSLVTSNYPVNVVRTLFNTVGAITSFFSGNERNRENSYTLTILKEEAERQRTEVLREGGNEEPLKMAEAALAKISEISGPLQRVSNAFKTGMNHNAERAALEQIAVSGLGGIRVGSCMSGKDREGGVSEYVAAMTAFYGKYKMLPPIPGAVTRQLTSEEIGLREEFETMVAKEFLAGHEQKIAADNARGANGLKNVRHVFGTNIVEKIKEILVNEYFKEASAEAKEYWENLNIVKATDKIVDRVHN